MEVLSGIADGLTDAEIGDRLCYSRHTVNSRVSRLLLKLGARTRAEAVAICFRSGLIK